jgi:hypothetical protein
MSNIDLSPIRKLIGIIPLIVGFMIINFAFGFDVPSEEEIMLDVAGEVLKDIRELCGTIQPDEIENCRTTNARLMGITSTVGALVVILSFICFWKL